MTETALQQAINCLALRDVYVRETQLTMNPDFDPLTPNVVGVQITVIQTRWVGITLPGEPPLHIMRFYIDTRVRFLESGIIGDNIQTEEDRRKFVRAELLTVFVVDYHKKCDDLPEEAVKEFAPNAVFHTWPYWREHIQTMCNRGRLPTLVLPMQQVQAFNPASAPNPEATSPTD